jgi:hypothetical protein
MSLLDWGRARSPRRASGRRYAAWGLDRSARPSTRRPCRQCALTMSVLGRAEDSFDRAACLACSLSPLSPVRCEPTFPGLRQIARNLRAFSRVQMRDVRSLSPAEVAIASILAPGLWALQSRSWRRGQSCTCRLRRSARITLTGIADLTNPDVSMVQSAYGLCPELCKPVPGAGLRCT